MSRPPSAASLWACVRDLRDRGTTVFLTTHYLEEADVLCDRLMIMDHGQIVAAGTPRDLKKEVLGDAIAITLRKDGQDAERALPLLRRQPYVRDLATAGQKVRIYVDDAGTVVPTLIRLLDSEDISIRSITLSEPSLDDVFLQKTGRSLTDTEGADGRTAQ